MQLPYKRDYYVSDFISKLRNGNVPCRYLFNAAFEIVLCPMSNLKNAHVMSLIFHPMSIGFMLNVSYQGHGL